jgi:hypothetical protein
MNLSFRGFSPTNEQEALFALSNGGPYVLQCGFGTEVENAGKWQDPPEGRSFDFASVPLLRPSSSTMIKLSPPGGTGRWRAVAQCERHYDDTDAGRRRRDFDWYVRKKAFIDTAHSEGISR